jgi:enoyl-CoA hydratase
LARDDTEFARTTLAAIQSKSPTTCKVSLRQLAVGATLPDFATNMAQEYRIGSRLLMLPDFAEGVRAVILDKDNTPAWSPANPQGVSEAMLDAIFAPLPALEEWKSL